MNPPEEHPLNALTEQVDVKDRKKYMGNEKALRTLEGDIREAIEERNASTASIVMAEQAKASVVPVPIRPPSNAWKKFLIAFASIFLIMLGAGGGYYLYLNSPLVPSVPVVQKTSSIPSIVEPDSQKTLDLTGLESTAVQTSVENALTNMGSGNNSILQIVPIEKSSTGTETIISASSFLTQIGIPAPDVLFRSLNTEWMLGTYNDNGTAAPFLVLTDNFFQNAYAGMIAWESTMADNFASLFGYESKAETNESNGTSTPPTSYFTIQGSFKDGVIENKDVRSFTEPDGTVLLLYSFVDNSTIVITTDENALAEIITRLEKQTFIQ